MNEILPQDAPLPNGAAPLGDVPVHGTEPVAPKKRRKRKAKPAAPKVARAPKVKPIDPLIAEHRSSSCVVGTAAAVEEAPASSIVQGVGADHFREARERSERRMFDENAPVRIAPPLKSSWWDRFVFGFRHMTGLDGDTTPMRPSTQFTILLCIISGVAVVGASYPFW